jgi:hypothetical protein
MDEWVRKTLEHSMAEAQKALSAANEDFKDKLSGVWGRLLWGCIGGGQIAGGSSWLEGSGWAGTGRRSGLVSFCKWCDEFCLACRSAKRGQVKITI